jgi:hypothetical protein
MNQTIGALVEDVPGSGEIRSAKSRGVAVEVGLYGVRRLQEALLRCHGGRMATPHFKAPDRRNGVGRIAGLEAC